MLCYKFIFAGLLFLGSFFPIMGQYIIKGKVTDAATNDPVPFATVGIMAINVGTTTDFDGNYILHLKTLHDSLTVSFLGYKSKNKAVDKTKTEQTIDIQLTASANQLSEVIIRAGENPAWPILRKVVVHKDQNDRKQLTAYEYDSYNRIELSMDKISDKLRTKKFMKKMEDAVAQVQKTVGEDGKPVLPVFVSETMSKFYFRDNPRKTKEVITHSRVKGIGLADESILNELLGGSFQDFNFYKNWVKLVGKDFHSPIADAWRTTYEYYLADTVQIGLNQCFGIDFEPKNKLDLAFTGKMWIDTISFAIAQIDVTVNKEANLNFIEKLKISQEFEPVDSSNAWLPAATRFLIDIGEITANSAGLLAKIYTHNRNFVVNKPRMIEFYEIPLESHYQDSEKTEAFWQQNRPQPLSLQEQRVYQMIDTLKNVPIVKTYTGLVRIAVGGFIPISPSVELGPFVNTFAHNSIEGARFQVGFRTREYFSKRWLLRGYVARGSLDHRWKYNAEALYTLSRHPWIQVGVRKSYEVERLGVNPQQLGSNSLTNQLFTTLSRFGNYRRAYVQDALSLTVSHEIMKGLTHSVSFQSKSFEPLYLFRYRTQPSQGELSPQSINMKLTEFNYEVRFAKGEVLIRNNNRRPLRLRKAREWPVVTFRYTAGMGGTSTDRHFTYHRFNLQVDKSFRLGILGRTNTEWQAGYSPSVVPYPLLFNHQGNPSPIFIPNAYNLMNFFEFTSNQFVSVGVFHDFEGLITNRLPLLRKLKWRSHVFAKVLMGDTRRENERIIPSKDPNGQPIPLFGPLQPGQPYIEVGYGFDNIFKFLRVDALHRLTYRDLPNAQKFGVKFSMAFKL
ncbi:DUF5686 family protein [Runella sp.]|uniref:DUF5686 and carboxypeptidase-like regulatory domain-containing protein n=1 Tax=Runella sp. TaxID=1960881 RepID=UPI00301B2444